MRIIYFIFLFLAFTNIQAQNTVYKGWLIRDEIIPFKKSEIENAKKYGVNLGHPYKSILVTLLNNGWKLSTERLEIESQTEDNSELDKLGLVCGEGYDAICEAEFVRGAEVIIILANPRTKSYSVEAVSLCSNEYCL